jgi:hypothetical protein
MDPTRRAAFAAKLNEPINDSAKRFEAAHTKMMERHNDTMTSKHQELQRNVDQQMKRLHEVTQGKLATPEDVNQHVNETNKTAEVLAKRAQNQPVSVPPTTGSTSTAPVSGSMLQAQEHLNRLTEQLKQGSAQTQSVFERFKQMAEGSQHLKALKESLGNVDKDLKGSFTDAKQTQKPLDADMHKHLDAATAQQSNILSRMEGLLYVFFKGILFNLFIDCVDHCVDNCVDDYVNDYSQGLGNLAQPFQQTGQAIQGLTEAQRQQRSMLEMVEMINSDRKNYVQPLHRGPFHASYSDATSVEWLEEALATMRLEQVHATVLRLDSGT